MRSLHGAAAWRRVPGRAPTPWHRCACSPAHITHLPDVRRLTQLRTSQTHTIKLHHNTPRKISVDKQI